MVGVTVAVVILQRIFIWIEEDECFPCSHSLLELMNKVIDEDITAQIREVLYLLLFRMEELAHAFNDGVEHSAFDARSAPLFDAVEGGTSLCETD